MNPRATFPASARLHRPSEYALALKGKRLARGALFVVSTPRESHDSRESGDTASGDTAGPRLGMIIAKRFARRAVTRNTIKRVIRESFRLRRHQLPAIDLVFRLQGPVGSVTLTELRKTVRQEIDTLLEKVVRQCAGS